MVAAASSIVFRQSQPYLQALMAIGPPEELTVLKNDSAMPTMSLTMPDQLVSVSPANETHLVHFVPVSSVDSFLLASNVAVSRALCKVQFNIGTLTSMVGGVSRRIVETVKDVKATVGKLMNTLYAEDIHDIDEKSDLIAPESVDQKNTHLMLDVALVFVVIMLGAQLQYKYG